MGFPNSNNTNTTEKSTSGTGSGSSNSSKPQNFDNAKRSKQYQMQGLSECHYCSAPFPTDAELKQHKKVCPSKSEHEKIVRNYLDSRKNRESTTIVSVVYEKGAKNVKKGKIDCGSYGKCKAERTFMIGNSNQIQQ